MSRGLMVADEPLQAASRELDLRLNAPGPAPVAVAVSGGGDSMALLRLAAAWAERAGRPLLALTVDHGLQPSGADWCAVVEQRAARLGVAARTLTWRGPKPAAGLPAAARAARHALVAAAAREAGASVVLMAHTADDVAEALTMRASGCSVPVPRAWSPSPAWPEGRGVFLLRPLLCVRRATLRVLLAEFGDTWIEDPANADLRFARAAARRRLATAPWPRTPSSRPADPEFPLEVTSGAAGDLAAPRTAFDGPGRRRRLGAMLVCAGGAQRPPRRQAVERLLERLSSGEDFVASLAGSRLEAAGGTVRCCREAGEQARGAMAEAEVPVGESVFDGRYLVWAREPGWRIRPLRGAAKRLSAAERTALGGLPAASRGALPVAVSPAGDLSCPILRQSGAVSARPLALERLEATLGCIADEASLWRVAKTPLDA